jgi:hypothetical protein
MSTRPDLRPVAKSFKSTQTETLLLLSVLAAVCLAIASAVRMAAIPYQLDYGEGLMVEGALSIRHSQPLYPNPFDFPVVLHEYGPVAYAAVASVLPGGDASFPQGRLLMLACSIALSLLLSSILWRETGSWRIGLSFGLLLLTLPAFRLWLYVTRADLIGVALCLVGVALYLWKPQLWYCNIPFFALAIFSKYTLIAAPMAVFAHLILNRQPKRGLGFAVTLGTVCTLTFAALQAATGRWFAFHMFLTHSGPYSVRRFLVAGTLVWASAPVVTLLALWYAARQFRARRWTFPAIYIFMSFLTAFTAGKLGANTNHFLEWMVAACMCAGLAYSAIPSEYPSKLLPVTLLLSVSVVAGAIVQSLQPPSGLAECGEAYQYVKNSRSNTILAENLGPLLAARKAILVSDPFAYFQMVRNGWPDRKLEELVKQRFFGLIVVETEPSQMKLGGSEIWPEPIVDAMNQNYRAAARFSCRGAAVMLEPISANHDQADAPERAALIRAKPADADASAHR